MINGTLPLLLDSTVRDDNLALAADLTNPDIYFDGTWCCPRTPSTWSRRWCCGTASPIAAGLAQSRRTAGAARPRLHLRRRFRRPVRGPRARRARHGHIQTEVGSAQEVGICLRRAGRAHAQAHHDQLQPGAGNARLPALASWRSPCAEPEPGRCSCRSPATGGEQAHRGSARRCWRRIARPRADARTWPASRPATKC